MKTDCELKSENVKKYNIPGKREIAQKEISIRSKI